MSEKKHIVIDHGPRPDPQRFRDTWTRHTNIRSVAQALGMAYDDCNYWAKVFRSHGIDIPRKSLRRRKHEIPIVEPSDTLMDPRDEPNPTPWVVAYKADVDRDRSGLSDLTSSNARDLSRAKDSIARGLASDDDDTVRMAIQRLDALERLKKL